MLRSLICAVSLGILLAGCGGGDSSGTSSAAEETTEPPKPATQQAYDECEAIINRANLKALEWSDNTVVEIADGGTTLVIATGSSAENVDFKAIGCVLANLDTPDAISTQMDNTTAMMGLQEATDGDLLYRWSYHPDNGMNIYITWEDSE